MGVLFIIIVLGALALVFIPGVKEAQAPVQGSGVADGLPATTTPLHAALNIHVTSPASSSVVSSPLTITGEARGTWFFEAVAPVTLIDKNGNIIAQGHITATSTEPGGWMTLDFVAFTGTLTFPPQPAGTRGYLVLSNDNPSGISAKQLTLDIPVKF